MSILDSLRMEAREAPPSRIAEVYAYGHGKPDLIQLWVGEGDLPTPSFISERTEKALRDGETFYTWQGGIPELREALARYHTRHFGRQFSASEFLVVGGGMQAIQLAMQATIGAGDEMIHLTPAWPNAPAACEITGAKAVAVRLDRSGNGWSCDMEKMAAAVTPRTRAIFVNSPANPTGWTADRDALAAILALARRHNLWIIADETYAQFHYDGGRAPSFLDVIEPEDRVLFVNTFSKNWAMTGWRIGWVGVNPGLQSVFENLIQYSTSGVAQFMQRGAVVALDEGDDFISLQVERARKSRDIVCSGLAATGRVRFAEPEGAFYAFFSVEGEDDARALAFKLVDRANVGLAPGTAFGPGAPNFLRLCFACSLDRLGEGLSRLEKVLK